MQHPVGLTGAISSHNSTYECSTLHFVLSIPTRKYGNSLSFALSYQISVSRERQKRYFGKIPPSRILFNLLLRCVFNILKHFTGAVMPYDVCLKWWYKRGRSHIKSGFIWEWITEWNPLVLFWIGIVFIAEWLYNLVTQLIVICSGVRCKNKAGWMTFISSVFYVCGAFNITSSLLYCTIIK